MIVDKIPTTIIEPRITQMISISDACKKQRASANTLSSYICEKAFSVKRKPAVGVYGLIILNWFQRRSPCMRWARLVGWFRDKLWISSGALCLCIFIIDPRGAHRHKETADKLLSATHSAAPCMCSCWVPLEIWNLGTHSRAAGESCICPLWVL